MNKRLQKITASFYRKIKYTSEASMQFKKGLNFKEIIKKGKNKGRLKKRLMSKITGINKSAMYCGFFLSFFAPLDALIYFTLSPGVFIWTLSLVITALLASVISSKLTHFLKQQQWKYSVI